MTIMTRPMRRSSDGQTAETPCTPLQDCPACGAALQRREAGCSFGTARDRISGLVSSVMLAVLVDSTCISCEWTRSAWEREAVC